MSVIYMYMLLSMLNKTISVHAASCDRVMLVLMASLKSMKNKK